MTRAELKAFRKWVNSSEFEREVTDGWTDTLSCHDDELEVGRSLSDRTDVVIRVLAVGVSEDYDERP